MKDLFDDITQLPQVRKRTAAVEVDCTAEWRRAFGVQQLIKVMGMERPEQGKCYHILTDGNVDLLSHLRWMTHCFGPMSHVALCAWDISMVDIMLLKRWVARRDIRAMCLMVGDRFPSTHPREWGALMEWRRSCREFFLETDSVHARFIAALPVEGEGMVLTSSAACTMNPRTELATFTVDSDLYEWYIGMLEEWRAARMERRVEREIEGLEVWNQDPQDPLPTSPSMGRSFEE